MENKFFRLKRLKMRLKRMIPVLFILISFVLIVLSVSGHPVAVKSRVVFWDVFAPVAEVLSAPVHWLGRQKDNVLELGRIRAENARLRAENEVLQSWKNIAHKLVVEQKELMQLLNYVPYQNSSFLTARIIGDYDSMFANSVIVLAGADNGVQKGDVAVTNAGLFGRVVDVGRHAARVLKITDYYSRLPVMVGEHRILCILTGDNTPYPKLTSLPEEADIKVGDVVLTSGHAGVYPSGLGVGVVTEIFEHEAIVQPFEMKDSIEFVRLIHFGLGGLLPEKTCPESTDE